MNGAAGTPDDAVMPSRPLAGPAGRPAAAAGRRAGSARQPGGAARPLTGPVLRRAAAPWRWLAGRTLRGRLIAGLLMLLALACAVAGGATYLAANRFLLIQLDDQLQASARLYAAACEHHGGFAPDGVPGGTGPGSPDGAGPAAQAAPAPAARTAPAPAAQAAPAPAAQAAGTSPDRPRTPSTSA